MFDDWLSKTDELNVLPTRRVLRCQDEFQRYNASWNYIIDTFLTPQQN
ncbi:hypothetical protein [Devosia sp. 2618]